MLLDQLIRTPTMAMLSPDDARLAIALRIWVVARKTGREPMGLVSARLGSAEAAAHLHLLMEEIGAAWPEPFCVSPPCCIRLSHDEATAVEMIGIGRRRNRPAFDRLLADLLPPDARERLYATAARLASILV
jgi:hypothetical protein